MMRYPLAALRATYYFGVSGYILCLGGILPAWSAVYICLPVVVPADMRV